jgi:translation initiation factor eIF-2B subunit gamma
LWPSSSSAREKSGCALHGADRSLFPFNEGANVLPKALMPVGNKPVINIVLDWVFAAGLTGASTWS